MLTESKYNHLETILSIRNLNKRFGHVHAVKNLSLEIQKGNIYGILGPNGSGKSTTLGIVLHVVNKTSGEYSWFDGKISHQQALKKIGAIIERPNFYPYLTAQENLELVCRIKDISFSKIPEKLKMVQLYERRNSPFSSFSLGMKQRLAIASALLNDPEILILDEPTNGLDPEGIRQIRDIIKTVASQGTTILLASHLLDEVEKVCTHVLVLQKGEVLYSGSVDGMTNTGFFFELGADENYRLKLVLQEHPAIIKAEEAEGKVLAYSQESLEASDLNRYLAEQGIYLNHLVKRKNSLEDQFLELTKSLK